MKVTEKKQSTYLFSGVSAREEEIFRVTMKQTERKLLLERRRAVTFGVAESPFKFTVEMIFMCVHTHTHTYIFNKYDKFY